MCGIVGLFLKEPGLRPELGGMLSDMLITLTDRGPDSAGIAIYGPDAPGRARITVQSDDPDTTFAALPQALRSVTDGAIITRRDSHAVIDLPEAQVSAARKALAGIAGLRIMGSGQRMEIFKETGLPRSVVDRFGIRSMAGSHGIGHSRMATESAVTTRGAHPFSTGDDQCLVHNGSLSNHNNLRRRLRAEGLVFETENDSEVAAAYLTAAMAGGRSLSAALTGALRDLDGFYTFVVGTRTGFAVLRDPIACKPAVMAETAAYVAFGSEYRALTGLPGIEDARVWEPEPATVYVWEH